MDVTATLKQAVVAAKAGRKAEARRLLETVLDADERNEQAWLWLSDVVESDEERIICLENVLTINPDNEMARKGLSALGAGVASSPQSPTSAPVLRDVSAVSDSPADRPRLADNRAFIAITIILALILIFTVASIVAFMMLTSPG
jgi:hypothetical protein